MTMRTEHTLAIIQSAYRGSQDAEDWLLGMLDAAKDALPGGALLALETDLSTATMRSKIVCHGSAGTEHVEALEIAHNDAPEWCVRATYGSGRTWISLRESVESSYFQTADWIAPLRGCGLQDMLGVVPLGYMPGAPACALFSLTEKPASATDRERALWDEVAVHLGVAQRLRTLREQEPEATLTPNGEIHDANGRAKPRETRDWLREQVRRREKSISTKSEDPESTLNFWGRLAGGDWALVDRFDSDGRRYVVAVSTVPNRLGLRRLSPREREVVTLAARGYTNDRIAIELSLAPSTVTSHLQRARNKMGIQDMTELLALGRAPGDERSQK